MAVRYSSNDILLSPEMSDDPNMPCQTSQLRQNAFYTITSYIVSEVLRGLLFTCSLVSVLKSPATSLFIVCCSIQVNCITNRSRMVLEHDAAIRDQCLKRTVGIIKCPKTNMLSIVPQVSDNTPQKCKLENNTISLDLLSAEFCLNMFGMVTQHPTY